MRNFNVKSLATLFFVFLFVNAAGLNASIMSSNSTIAERGGNRDFNRGGGGENEHRDNPNENDHAGAYGAAAGEHHGETQGAEEGAAFGAAAAGGGNNNAVPTNAQEQNALYYGSVIQMEKGQ